MEPKIALIILATCVNSLWALEKACSLEIIVDPHFHAFYREKHSQNGHLEVKRKLKQLMQDYVDFNNDILRKYSFFPDGSMLYLYIKRIKIINPSKDCDEDASKFYCDYSKNLHELLVSHSKLNHNDVCLSFVFTYQQLTDSTLGLAWTANSAEVDEGGVCARYHEIIGNESSPSHWESHNTGVFNLAYNYRELPANVAKLAFAHEIGHSLGSPHDYPKDCLGDEISGNYLMHKSGVRGYLEHNYQLSRCSYHNISLFLSALNKQSRNCFESSLPKQVCGNGLVESWEECDCGETSEDCEESCCFPADHRDSPCQLKPRTLCSPSEGPCCNEKCEFVADTTCKEENECIFASRCQGSSAKCPTGLHKSDTASCESGSKICRDGKCAVSICAKFNMIECSQKDASPCEIHCQAPNRPHTCKPTRDLEALFAEPVHRPQGSPCDMPLEGDEYTLGTCSENQECLGGHPNLSSSSWAVGLGIFLFVYAIFMILAVWVYCRYCRKPPKPRQELVLHTNSNCD